MTEPNFQQQPKAAKRRKSQSEEEYQRQRALYTSKGPLINTESWLFEQDYINIDYKNKMNRVMLKNAAERAYYLRDYQKAIDIIKFTDEWQLGDKERKEYDDLRRIAQKKLDS